MSAPDRSGLRVRGAAVTFGTRPGLADISLDVGRGERVALLGPSGAGKTSLLRALAGLGGLRAGSVVVDGTDVTALPPERRGIVYMHQAPSLFPHLSVLDNVAFPLEIRGIPRDEARQRARDLLARVQLTPFGDRAPTALSGGQRHRVALARALAAHPAVLLLDEPFSALDPELRAEVRDAVVRLLGADGGPAVVLVTHDVDEAAGLADRLAVLLDGRVAQTGAAAALLATPASLAVARFLGLPNLLPGMRDAAGIVTSPLGRVAHPGPPGPVTVSVRPGDLRARRAAVAAPGTRSDMLSGTLVGVVERVAGTSLRVRLDGHAEGAQGEHSRGQMEAHEVLAAPDGLVERRAGIPVALEVHPSAIHVMDGSSAGAS